jgi:hypothetical protein
MNIIEEIWEFPITLLSWIVYNLVILTDGKWEWLFCFARWTGIDGDMTIEIENENDET